MDKITFKITTMLEFGNELELLCFINENNRVTIRCKRCVGTPIMLNLAIWLTNLVQSYVRKNIEDMKNPQVLKNYLIKHMNYVDLNNAKVFTVDKVKAYQY